MRPLRELWGHKLLVSGSEQQQAQQRLVSVVADFLHRGKSPARIRKELEVCPLDQVLCQFCVADRLYFHSPVFFAGTFLYLATSTAC